MEITATDSTCQIYLLKYHTRKMQDIIISQKYVMQWQSERYRTSFLCNYDPVVNKCRTTGMNANLFFPYYTNKNQRHTTPNTTVGKTKCKWKSTDPETWYQLNHCW